MADLKSCPFDGGEAFLQHKGRDVVAVFVWCSRCGIHGPARSTDAEAIAAWNTRTTPLAEQAGEVERLRDAIRTIMARCEALEDEAVDQAEHEEGLYATAFLSGQKTTAKSLRRHLHDLSRTTPPAAPAPTADATRRQYRCHHCKAVVSPNDWDEQCPHCKCRSFSIVAETADAVERAREGIDERRAVNIILSDLLQKLQPECPDMCERITVGNEACTAILAALQPRAVPDDGEASEAVERVVRAMYDAWPSRAVSRHLQEITGLAANEVIPFDKVIEAGGTHDGLYRLARAAVAAQPGAVAGDVVEHARDFRWRAAQCRTNPDAFDTKAAAIWDLAADALEGKQ